MKIYFAPMEGITDGIFRQAHRKIFGGIDVYCLPFHKLTQSFSLLTREERDISPEENEGLNVLPQALTRDPAQLAAWYTTLYEGWKDRFGATIALGRIKKLMEWPAEGDVKRKRLLRRADQIESCIDAVI